MSDAIPDAAPPSPRPSKVRGCFYRLLALTFGLTIACGIVEGVSRYYFARASEGVRESIANDPTNVFRLYRRDDRMGWVYRPGVSVMVDDPSVEPHTITINEKGLFDLDYSYDHPANGFRVLVVGDSYIEAVQVALHQRSFQALEDRYQAETGSDPYEIIEMGVGRYTPAQYYDMYLDQGRRYHPDVVIVALTMENDIEMLYNDAGHNLEGVLTGHTMSYTLNDGKLVELDVHDWRPPSGRSRVPERVGIIPSLSRFLSHNSVAYDLLTWNWNTSQLGVNLGVEGGHIPLARRFEKGYDDPLYAQAWPVLDALVLALMDAVEADGAEFGVIIVPERYAIYPDWYFQTYPEAEQYRDLFDARKMDRKAEAFLKENSISYLNLTPYLLDAATTSNDPLYSKAHIHWTPAGHAVVTEALDNWFHRMNWAPAGK